MDWLHEYFYTPINFLLVVRGSSDIVFAVIFFIISIKTSWEVKRYKKNGFMLRIKNLTQASGFKFLIAAALSVNGIIRTEAGYPPEITFLLLVIDIGITIWLGITMYNLAYDILMEEPDEQQPNDISPGPTSS